MRIIRSITVIAVAGVVMGSAFPGHAQGTPGTVSSKPAVKAGADSLKRTRDTGVTKSSAATEDSLLRLRDTNATKSALTYKLDSLNTIPAPAGGDTSHKPLSALAGALPEEDTTYAFWRHPYWGGGIGWGLGSNPFFTEWQSGLPDSAAMLVGHGTALPKFTVVEPVNSYNIFWPLLVSYTPVVTERHSLSLDGAFYFLFSDKSFKASVAPASDSLLKVIWNQSCAVSFFSMGFTYRRTVPEEYFKVEGVKRTTGNIGLSLIPYMRFAKRTSFSTSGAIPDSITTVLRATMDNRTFNGFGLSWKVGISSLKKLSSKSGLEVGLTYIGRYVGNFRSGTEKMLWKDVNPSSGKLNEKVSFLSHTFEISLVLQNGKAVPLKDAGGAVSPPKDTTKAAATGDSLKSVSPKDGLKDAPSGGGSKAHSAADTIKATPGGDASKSPTGGDASKSPAAKDVKGADASKAAPTSVTSKVIPAGSTSKAATAGGASKTTTAADTLKSTPAGGISK
jgi:hypothetical protein